MREKASSRKDTIDQTKNYVSGDRMPSSSGHKFKNSVRNPSKENGKSSSTGDKTN